MEKATEEIFVEIIRDYMGLPSGQIVVRDQNFKVPNDQKIYVVVGMVDSRPYSAQSFIDSSSISEPNYVFDGDDAVYDGADRVIDGFTYIDTVIEKTRTQLRENIQIDIMSRDKKAILQRNEVYLAVNSIRAKQAQEKYNFKIARIPTNFINTSAAEGGSNINRFTMTIPCLVWYEKETILSSTGRDYYDDFTTRVDDEKTIGTPEGIFEFRIDENTPDPTQLP